ncbi:MAG: hypothetical protein NUV69_03175 [Candidatus Curtissbacteria bacterium]|nr:hypothetical protein [Candidatus Curtissbacteria bacterium]
MKKGFAPVVLLLCVLFVVVTVFGTHKIMEWQQPKDQSISQDDIQNTSAWTTQETVLGFSITFPNTWRLEAGDSKTVVLRNYFDANLAESDFQGPILLKPDKISITIGQYDESLEEDLSLLDWLEKENRYSSAQQDDPTKVEQKTIAGNPALVLFHSNPDAPFYVFNNQKRVYFAYFSPSNSDYTPLVIPILDSIKFLQ